MGAMDIARATVHKFIKTKESFTPSELYTEISKKGGIMRISIGVTVDDYLKEFEDQGTLDWDFDDKKYIVNQDI